MRRSALWADLQVGQQVGRVALYQHVEHLVLKPLRPRQNWLAHCAVLRKHPLAAESWQARGQFGALLTPHACTTAEQCMQGVHVFPKQALLARWANSLACLLRPF